MSLDKNTKEVKAIIILEILGRPKEHLLKTLSEHVDHIGSEKGVTIVEKKLNEPKEIEGQKDIFMSYAEVEVVVENPFVLSSLMFKYMPAHIEVISPEVFTFKNNEFGDILSEVTRRLHSYEDLARIFQVEKQKMQDQIVILEEKIASKEKPKNSKKK